MHTVLVIGGSGFFGQRICRALSLDPSIRVLMGGRDRARSLRTANIIGLDGRQVVTVDAGDRQLAQRLGELATYLPASFTASLAALA
jgi:uncharacterized protein YbjT (DUF2867 family)